MLNMDGFEYKEGNKVSFDGFFGKVELTYHAEGFDFMKQDDPFDESQKSEPYFDACLFVDSQSSFRASAEASTAEKAVEELYKNHALYLAMEDTDSLQNQ